MTEQPKQQRRPIPLRAVLRDIDDMRPPAQEARPLLKPQDIERARWLLCQLAEINALIEKLKEEGLSLAGICFKPAITIDTATADAIIYAVHGQIHRQRAEIINQLAALGVEIDAESEAA